MRMRIGLVWALVGVLVVACLGAGVAYATGTIAPSAGGVYFGCVAQGSGILRIVASASNCHPNESSVSLSGAPSPQTLAINCAEGQTIPSDLSTPPDSVVLTIDIRGRCTQTVDITTENVRLVGVTPKAAIVSPGATQAQTVGIFGPASVTISHLDIVGGSTGVGVWGAGATVTLFDDTISNSTVGVLVATDSVVNIGATSKTGPNTTITGTGSVGLRILAGRVDMGGAITGSHGDGVEVGGLGALRLQGTVEHSGGVGVDAFTGGAAGLQGATILDNSQIGVAATGSEVEVSYSQIAGNGGPGVVVGTGGRLSLGQSANVTMNAGDGVTVMGGSVASFSGFTAGDVISTNGGDGVSVHDASVANFPTAKAQITGNGQWGIYCESSPADAMITGSPGTVSGNHAGQVSCPVGR